MTRGGCGERSATFILGALIHHLEQGERAIRALLGELES